MASGDELVEKLKVIFSYNLVSLMFVFTILLIYGFGKDYILFNIYSIAQTFESTGLSQSWVSPFIASIADYADILPQYIDLFWLLLTVTLFAELIIASYYAKREGWFSVLGFLTFGMLFFLFMTGIFSVIGDWFKSNLIDAVFGGVTYATPFLNFYLNHLFIVNTLVVVVCVIANFIDLDFSSFENRKDKESLNEIV